MEMALVDAAVRLGGLLNRTVVLPFLPILESLEYQGGIEEYFELQPGTDWISTKLFRERYGGGDPPPLHPSSLSPPPSNTPITARQHPPCSVHTLHTSSP